MRPALAARPLALSLSLLALACGGPKLTPEQTAAFTRAMSQGKAWLENKDSAKAIEAFTTAARTDPRSAAAARNLARAKLLARDHAGALAALQAAAKAERASAATRYLTGITHAREGRHAEAIVELEQAAKLDPETAAVRFQLAAAYQAAERPDDAWRELNETVRIDPQHVTTYYRLARASLARGDRAQYDRWNGEFLRLRSQLGADSRTPEELETCRYTVAELAPPPADRGAEPDPPAVRFADATAAVLAAGTPALTTAAVLDLRPDGHYLLAALAADGTLGLLAPAGPQLAFRPAEGAPRLDPAAVLVAADWRNEVKEGVRFDPKTDARPDLLALEAGGPRLLLRTGEASFRDVTAGSGLPAGSFAVARFADTDHDGDLDLLLGGAGGLALWQNNGDGTFRDATSAAGLNVTGAVADVAAADLDADVAIDLVVARRGGSTTAWMGQRLGRFAPRGEAWPEAERLAAEHFAGGGAPPAVALLGSGKVALRTLAGDSQPDLGIGGLEPAALAVLDADNDGRPELAIGSGSAVSLLRADGGGRFSSGIDLLDPASRRAGAVRGLEAADLDGDGDSDLLVTGASGLALLRNEGGNAFGQLKVRLVGTKTNPQGLGTEVEVRAGAFRAARFATGTILEIGTGPHRQLDAVRTVWGNGVVDNQVAIGLPAGALEIVEKNVATGSCPFLYAWDGETFRFVTDILGNAPIGLPISRELMMAADPDELVEIGPAERLPEKAGTFHLAVTSEFREIFYFDHARLLAVDHDPGIEVHATDKLMPAPFPPSELWALAPAAPLRSARADEGPGHATRDETAALAALDGRWTTAGVPLPPPFRGQTFPHALTLDFGPLPVERPLVLALSGWLQYGDASTNIALSQSKEVKVVPPTIEVEGADGGFRPLPVVVGMPAGKSKTILVDLAGELPRGAKRLRLTTSFEIRWDRIALFERRPASALATTAQLATSAEMSFRGFSRLAPEEDGGPTRARWDEVSPSPPWRTALEGWSTRYGDVLELVARRDGRLAILNSGDAVALSFDARAFPPVPPGKVRTFFFESVGWDKDSDPNIATGWTVEPLPSEPGVPTPDEEWKARYNTRWVPLHRFGEGR
ncbi:MAG TPA: FG-GAP-like repeat-containing protein [Thermoanaerobaculia bacterium]|nr:FG-GAP-like repeat-containing protein [Thermoanaerobaculia bacterium]